MSGVRQMEKSKGQWSSKLGFVLASAGAAIGLGAIWKMPYVAGQSGGGAFFLIFVVLTLIIGLPMLLSEYIIGRAAQKKRLLRIKCFRQIQKFGHGSENSGY